MYCMRAVSQALPHPLSFGQIAEDLYSVSFQPSRIQLTVRDLIFVFSFLLFADTFSLRLTKTVIPTYKFHGETALLECQYELNPGKNNYNNQNYHNRFNNNRDYGFRSIHTSITDDNNGIDHLYSGGSSAVSSDEEETLYSVKWYKDNEEFYRYVPKANPQQQSYRVEGIRVDVSIPICFFLLLFLFHCFFFRYHKDISAFFVARKRDDDDTNFKCHTVPLC